MKGIHMNRFDNKTVLVTGAASGMGLAAARRFLDEGARVVMLDIDEATLNEAAGSLPQERVLVHVGDTAKEETASAAVAAAVARFGGLDILINNAGYGAMGPVLDGGVDGLREQFETNVFALVGVTRTLFPLLRRNRGLVINIGSVSGVLVTPFAGTYCASKAAVHALNTALRLELAPFGIRVMEVQPGAIASQFASNAQQQAEHLIAADSPWWPLREHIRARARASQDKPTPTAEFAQGVLAAAGKSPVPALVRLGNGSRALPLLAWLLPRRLLDSILRKRFGLLRPL